MRYKASCRDNLDCADEKVASHRRATNDIPRSCGSLPITRELGVPPLDVVVVVVVVLRVVWVTMMKQVVEFQCCGFWTGAFESGVRRHGIEEAPHFGGRRSFDKSRVCVRVKPI